MAHVVVTTATTTPPHLITFWGALKVVATNMAAKLTTISWSVETFVPKGPDVAMKFIITQENHAK